MTGAARKISDCCLCGRTAVQELMDFGPQPICNRYLPRQGLPEFKHPVVLGQCSACGLVQLLRPVPAKELAPQGIRVNAVAPGFIDTDMTRRLPKEKYDQRLNGIRMGRIGTPEDVARAILFFASDLSAYVTGQVLGVDGGMQI